MTLRQYFHNIKPLFLPRRVSTRSRRKAEGHCDLERRVIEIAVQGFAGLLTAEEAQALLDNNADEKGCPMLERIEVLFTGCR